MSRHVDPDLVGAARLQLDVEEAGGAVRLDQVVMGHRRLALGGDRPLVVVVGVAADGGVDGAAHRVRVALDEGVVLLLDDPVAELGLEQGVRALGLGDDHQSGGADVEAVDDALALGGAGGRDPVPGGGEAADDGGAGPAGAGVGGDADRLHDDHDVVVVVDDLHALDGLGDDLDRRSGLRHLHLQPGAPVDPLGLPGHRAVHLDLPGGGQLGGLGAGEAEHAGDGGVDALALQTVRYGQGADLGVRTHQSSMPCATRSPYSPVSPCGRSRRGPGP